jgi:peptidoglycan/LPS O-acetylase OafA/YrhL
MARKVGVEVKRPRNLRVEVLRLLAILGIAIFHTFLPWFNSIAYGAQTGVDTSALSQSAPMLFFLGLFSLLGAMGNHVFYMISGFFLLPRIANDSVVPGFWGRQYRAVARRVIIIVVSVVLYAAIVLVIDHWWDIPNVSLSSAGWLLGGLEFIWIYLALIVVAPLAGWLQRRWSSGWPVFIVVVFLAVASLNVYIAFFSQGGLERGFFDWRKLMSAATYAIGFLLAGFIGSRWEYFERLGHSLLFGSIFMAVVIELLLSLAHDGALIGAVSFKSTSIVSFLLAAGALIAALSRDVEKVLPGVESVPARAVRWLATATLGFYIVQSMLYAAWNSVSTPLLDAIVQSGVGGVDDMGYTVVSLWSVLLFVVVGIVFSAAFVALVLVIDRLVRHSLLSLLKLER